MRSHSKQQGGGRIRMKPSPGLCPRLAGLREARFCGMGPSGTTRLNMDREMVPGTFSQVVSKTFHCLY